MVDALLPEGAGIQKTGWLLISVTQEGYFLENHVNHCRV